MEFLLYSGNYNFYAKSQSFLGNETWFTTVGGSNPRVVSYNTETEEFSIKVDRKFSYSWTLNGIGDKICKGVLRGRTVGWLYNIDTSILDVWYQGKGYTINFMPVDENDYFHGLTHVRSDLNAIVLSSSFKYLIIERSGNMYIDRFVADYTRTTREMLIDGSPNLKGVHNISLNKWSKMLKRRQFMS